MTIQAIPNEVRLPLIRIGSLNLLACLLIAGVGAMIALQQGGVIGDGGWTLLATIPGVLVGAGILKLIPARQASDWAIPVLAGTLIRAMGTLTIGIAIYILIAPSKSVFFLTLLGALTVTLIVDVSSVLSLINKHTSGDLSIAGAEGVS